MLKSVYFDRLAVALWFPVVSICTVSRLKYWDCPSKLQSGLMLREAKVSGNRNLAKVSSSSHSFCNFCTFVRWKCHVGGLSKVRIFDVSTWRKFCKSHE